jgi:hypothetical protein
MKMTTSTQDSSTTMHGWLVDTGCGDTYGPFESLASAQWFARRIGGGTVCECHGRLVESKEITREEYEELMRQPDVVRSPDDFPFHG